MTSTKLEQLRVSAKSSISTYCIALGAFLLIYLQQFFILGVVCFFLIFAVGYLLFAMDVAYSGKSTVLGDANFDDIEELGLFEGFRQFVWSVLQAQKELSDSAGKSIFLGMKLREIFPVMISKETLKDFLLSFLALLLVTFSVPLGYLRGKFVEERSTYSMVLSESATLVEVPQPQNKYFHLVSVALTTGNSVIVKSEENGGVYVIPLDAIVFLQKSDVAQSSFGGASSF